MYRIALINMPFGTAAAPSLALEQLKVVVERELAGEVAVDIVYLNQECAALLGEDQYNFIAETPDAHAAALGDWIFRQAAFPSLKDNADSYFRRYFPRSGGVHDAVRAAILRARGQLDAFLAAAVRNHRLTEYDLVGFTSMFSQTTPSIALARLLKTLNPDIEIVIGGANCESPMGEELARNVGWFDFVFSGPGLKSFPTFIRLTLEDELEARHALNGVFTMANVGGERAPPARVIGDELSLQSIVRVDYNPFLDQLERNLPQAQSPATLYFETSRGCWWGERSHCTFCGLNGMTMKYRSMAAQAARDQLEDLFTYFPRVRTLFCVDNIMPKNYIEEVFKDLPTPEGVSIFYEVKADLKDEDLRTLAAAGVTCLQPGIESLFTPTLKLMKKGTTALGNVRFMMSATRHKVELLWNILVGFPSENTDSYEHYLEMFPLLVHIAPPLGIFPIRFDRFSPYFTKSDAYGLNLAPNEFYDFIYPFPKDSIANLAYYFSDLRSQVVPYSALARSLPKLEAAVRHWQARWRGGDGALAAELRFASPERLEVIDTRSGARVLHRLSQEERELLAFLETPDHAERVDRSGWSAGVTPLDVLRSLRGKRLILEENGRALCLVSPTAIVEGAEGDNHLGQVMSRLRRTEPAA